MKNAISTNWNMLSEKEIEILINKIYANDGESIYNPTYNRWYFYKFCDGSISVSRITWDTVERMDNFEKLLAWLDWYSS